MLILIAIIVALGLILLAGPSVLKVILNWTAAIVPVSRGVVTVGLIVIGVLVLTNMIYKSIVQGKVHKKHKGDGEYLRKKCYRWGIVTRVVNVLAMFYMGLIILNPLLVKWRDAWVKVIDNNLSGFSNARVVGMFLLAIGVSLFIGGYVEKRKRGYYADDYEEEEPVYAKPAEEATSPRRRRQENHVRTDLRRPETRYEEGPKDSVIRPAREERVEPPVTDRDLDIEIPKI